MKDLEWLTLALQALAILLTLWVLWPHLLLYLGLVDYRNGTYGAPGDLNPDDKDATYQDRYRQLVDLGFQPLGILWERVGRSLTTQQFVFGNAGKRCMAGVSFRSGHAEFLTAFDRGAAVVTTDADTTELKADDCRLICLPKSPLSAVHLAHQRQIEEFMAQGYEPLPSGSLADYAQHTQVLNANPATQRYLRKTALAFIGVILGLLFIVGAPLVWFFGLDMPIPWLVIIVLDLFFLWQWLTSSVQVRLKDVEDYEAPAR